MSRVRAACAARIAAAIFAAVLLRVNAAAAETLRDALTALAAAHDFEIEGVERVGREAARNAPGNARARLAALLADYDHVLLGRPPGLERVIILGEKRRKPAAVTVDTTRRGAQHLVNATLVGAAGKRRTLSLMVDTGASTVVLPASMAESLGFRIAELPERRSRTANGLVVGNVARLEQVNVGGAAARDVDVMFIADHRLGETRLLGMSYFEHFTLTIDHDGNRLLLKSR